MPRLAAARVAGFTVDTAATEVPALADAFAVESSTELIVGWAGGVGSIGNVSPATISAGLALLAASSLVCCLAAFPGRIRRVEGLEAIGLGVMGFELD